MTLNNIKTMNKERGFTIVELLIVIVVIAILAAITIVAYNGIQNRAKTTKAQTNAAAAQKVAEAYNADNSRYPGTSAEFSSTTTKLPAGVTLLIGAGGTLGAANGETAVDYDYEGTSATTATGGRIRYWDFSASPAGISSTVIYLGTSNSGSTFTNIAS